MTYHEVERRKKEAKIEGTVVLSRTQLKEKLNLAKAEWDDFVAEEKMTREECYLDYHENGMPNDGTDESNKRRERIIESVKKTLRRNYGFKCLTENTGKGKKSGLKSLRVLQANGEEETICNRDVTDEKMRERNLQHFSKVKTSHACNDKTHENLLRDSTRDRTLRGRIRREDFDNQETHEFFKLAHQPNLTQLDSNCAIDEEDFQTVV